MKTVSPEAFDLIVEGGFERQWVFDLMYDGDRRLSNVEIEAPEIEWDGDSFVTASGTAKVVWSDDHAQSLIPRQIGDWFSPFGAELQVDCLLRAGSFQERIPMGRLLIEEVPDAVEAQLLWEGRLIHPGEAFTVALKDRLVKVQRDEFPFPTKPRSFSVWEEIQSITGMPTVRNIDDTTIPAISYEGDRADALKALFDVLDAWPHVDSSGALTARPKAWPEPVDNIRAVIAAPPSMTARYTYNRVVVEGKSPEGDPLFGVREITDGFLRVRNDDGSQSPFGGSTYRYKSDFLHTQTQVDLYAEQLLPRVAKIRSVTREITEPFNPLREVGDVLRFRDGIVRVQKVSHPGGVTRLTVEVPDAG